jgi:error-prone DNA polymerase
MGWANPPIPWRDFERRLSWGTGTGAGAVTDLASRRRPAPPAPTPKPSAPKPGAPKPGAPWAELHCHSSYSFLDGASDPAALVEEAVRLGVEAVGLTDHDGMYGVVQFAQAAKGRLATLFGAELSLGESGGGHGPDGGDATARGKTGEPDPPGRHLLVLARDAEGYRRLCAQISAAQLAGGEKGRPRYDLDALTGAHHGHWAVLSGCRKGFGDEAGLRQLIERFGRENVYAELIDHDQPGDDARNHALHDVARGLGVEVVASNNVHYAAPRDADLAETLAAVRARRGLDDMVAWLPATGTAHLRSAEEMAARLRHFPGVLAATVELARASAFDFAVMAPRLPYGPSPPEHTEASWLRELVAMEAPARYGLPFAETTPGAYAQIERELRVIEDLGYPGYFLIVHDIVRFCRENDILCQGRGSAANSAVCYALGITNVDAVRHRLLFERFLSPGREGPPDIDLDIEHRRREEAIQYVYRTYGRDCAAQVANVISYRPRMAVRDAARALGHSPGQQDAWSRRVGRLGTDPPGTGGRPHEEEEEEETADGPPPSVRALAERMQRLPRHLGIHSGGMVVCDRPVGEICPVEWARMPNRSVLQWDKDDCAAAGLVKFDLLGLGMLSALHDCFDLVAAHHGKRYALHSIPTEDPLVYDMLCDADTVGVFQVESRAQMATLPRLRPREFYDLVVEVALIRPGPIQGGSVHPYLRRRKGEEPRTCPHPSMENALGRTLGVPLFQEQMMQLAIDCAGFTPAEADRLRQAMSAKRAPERIEELRERLLAGMAGKGISPQVAEEVYEKILGFASFGFPESHAQSFAHLVYASAWLKRHHPAAFTAALLRNQPMGFYAPQTLIGDARRHGVQVLGIDINASDVRATLGSPFTPAEGHPHAPGTQQPAIRLGLDLVRNLGSEMAEAIAGGRPYGDMEDLALRVPMPAATLEALATAGAFDCWGLGRREAIWAAGALARTRRGQLPGTAPGTEPPALPPMTPVEETIADLWATGTSANHPIGHVRDALAEYGAVTMAATKDIPHGTNIKVAGVVTHRQRPQTAGGIIFMNLEDETGMINVVVRSPVWERHRRAALDGQALLVHGRLERSDPDDAQREGGAINLVATRLQRLPIATLARSRDFR